MAKRGFFYDIGLIIRTAMVILLLLERYSTMLQYPYLNFLKKAPVLLPVGWFIRIFKELKNNGLKTAQEIAKKSKVSQEQIDKRSKMYDDWGL